MPIRPCGASRPSATARTIHLRILKPLVAYALAVIALAAAGLIAVETVRYVVATFGKPAPVLQSAPPVEPVALPAAPVDEPPDIPPPLVARDPYGPTPDQPQEFVTLALVQPDAFCRSLENAGLKNPAFVRAPWPAENWSCVPEMLKATEGDEDRVSSLFVSVRGDELDRIASVRLKLNLIDPATTPRIRAVAKDILWRVTAAFGDNPPPEILNAIDAGRDASVEDRGAIYEIKREFGDQRRDNLFVNFKQKLGEGGEDRFVPTMRR